MPLKPGGGGVARRVRSLVRALLLAVAAILAVVPVAVALVCTYPYVVMAPRLPPIDALTNYQPELPLRVYTADHVLIGEFGAERRDVMKFSDIPDVMKRAVLAIEDYRFYERGGVDFVGISRAALEDFRHHGSTQGASTITMQLARNFFLSSEKTYTRKVYEMMLAWEIEHALTKDQILEVYMNQIYLGERAYGFAAAAQVYFGKDLRNVTVGEAAMLAGLPKAPSAYNPVANPARAKIRQQYILKRMLYLGYISAAQYDASLREQIVTRAAGRTYAVNADNAAEIARQLMFAQYGQSAYTRGLDVVTTIVSADQEVAYRAVRKGVMDYDRRHGYRGPERYISLPSGADGEDEAVEEGLARSPANGELVAAVVTAAQGNVVQARLVDGTVVTMSAAELGFAQASLADRTPWSQRIRRGAVVRLAPVGDGRWEITQLPEVEGALVSMRPQDGAIRALVGGFDFGRNRFNHVTQAWRQPGSSFKPFIYSAALEKGLGPATIVNDATLYFAPASPGAEPWEPKDDDSPEGPMSLRVALQKPWEPKDDDSPEGPMSLRVALQKSKNLVAIRVLSYIGVKYGRDFVTQRFGFDPERTPPYLPMALGAGLVTPLQSASAYAVFANGGYRINPYLIREVTDSRGVVLSGAHPLVAGRDAPQVITPRNAFIMSSLLHSVATVGTGAGTNVLHRSDLQGKTGTTNDARDGWFAGYQRSLVAVAWMGYDQPRSLGSREFGAQLALPIWVDYMGHALQGIPQEEPDMPAGIATDRGELYYDDLQRGSGFVASIGVESPGASGDTDDAEDTDDADGDMQGAGNAGAGGAADSDSGGSGAATEHTQTDDSGPDAGKGE